MGLFYNISKSLFIGGRATRNFQQLIWTGKIAKCFFRLGANLEDYILASKHRFVFVPHSHLYDGLPNIDEIVGDMSRAVSAYRKIGKLRKEYCAVTISDIAKIALGMKESEAVSRR